MANSYWLLKYTATLFLFIERMKQKLSITARPKAEFVFEMEVCFLFDWINVAVDNSTGNYNSFNGNVVKQMQVRKWKWKWRKMEKIGKKAPIENVYRRKCVCMLSKGKLPIYTRHDKYHLKRIFTWELTISPGI